MFVVIFTTEAFATNLLKVFNASNDSKVAAFAHGKRDKIPTTASGLQYEFTTKSMRLFLPVPVYGYLKSDFSLGIKTVII